MFQRIQLTAIVMLIGCLPLTAEEPGRTRILMVTQSAGFQHQPVRRVEGEFAPAELAMRQLADRSGEFTLDCTQDVATDFTRENLQNYDLVLFYTSGDLPIAEDDLDYFLNDWLRRPGHGLLGFHSASDTYNNHQSYWDMIGGTFDSHPWRQDAHVTITVHDTDHPAMKPFGSEFEIQDEIYQYRNWQPEKTHVLMSLNMKKTAIKRPYHVPVAWTKQLGEGRLFYNNLGHRSETWQNPIFLKSVIEAIRWTRGTIDGDATPNPEVSAKQHRLSVQAAHKAGITLESLAEQEKLREAQRKQRQQQRAARQARQADKSDS